MPLLQAITSITVNEVIPHIFCTTSRDFSTRVYDLNFPPKQKPNNPFWLPGKTQSFAGPAHGLDMSEPEGKGELGRCIMVLTGGRSGGHEADVLSAVSIHILSVRILLLLTLCVGIPSQLR